MTKKLSKAEDAENKKMHEDIRRKKNYDTALKKMSNGKVTEGGENQTAPSPNYKKILRDIRETKEREDLLRLGGAGTIKRMRTISKKKLN